MPMKIEIQTIVVDKGNLIISPTPNSRYLIYRIVDEMRKSGKPYTADIEPTKKKRSLNANAYMWHLVGEIADLLRKDKDSVYLEMLKSYGQSQIISVIKPGVERLKRAVKYFEECGETILNGKEFVHIKVFTGSSEMDTREMSILIDGVVSEAKALDIETMTPEQLSLLKSQWKE